MQVRQLLQDLNSLAAAFVDSLQQAGAASTHDSNGSAIAAEECCAQLKEEIHSNLAMARSYLEVRPMLSLSSAQ